MNSATLAHIAEFEIDYESRALWWAVASMLLTTVHHIYGGVIYHTPWRHHAAIVAVVGWELAKTIVAHENRPGSSH